MLDMSMIMKNAWEIKRKENKNMSESLKKLWNKKGGELWKKRTAEVQKKGG